MLHYAALAIGFLVFGGAVGGAIHLVTSGAISFSSPETGQSDPPANPPGQEIPVAENGQSDTTPVADQDTPTESGPEQDQLEEKLASGDELDLPADPFFDMAVSAVIPLAGDPVLLKSDTATSRIELSERPIPENSGSSKAVSFPTISAYVLDSQMLDENGALVIRAPGTESDFQFGNFGGGQDTDTLEIDEAPDQPEDAGAGLPVFLKPPTDTLNLFMSERPIGQGPNRIEILREIDKSTSLAEFLKEHGFDEEATKSLLKFYSEEIRKGDLIAGDQIAVRGVRMPNKVGRIGDYYRPVQLSLYGKEGYVGTAAFSTSRSGEPYVHGADPWFGKTIAQEKIVSDKNAADAKKHRLIDGLYATAVRNAVPASIVGEAIAYLAPMTDLKRAVKPDERFTLVFTDAARDEKRGGGRVLFAGVRRGDTWSVRCYVLKAPGNRGFACVSEGGKVSLSGAMLVPVKGVLTSKFGMRFHPIKKTQRLHAGVDWAAPTGTPIRAAFSGKVTYRDVRGGYGNFIELSHKGGITTRYAHMHEYGDGIELGTVVQAGDLIGYVGTTGLSTGPHLHFEIRQRGEPTDPLEFEMETGTDAPQSVASKDLKDYRTAIAGILTGQ
ncbi:MAG: M23 family metallopeptidase [Roseibium sp.]|uniref:M23 family metallopeptidase n=1 Tax=Roseibium sp. TaxID=1936156 RepID=UPI001B19312A|nr:M23 family metallopeptidase [Roseibium sp.]MBO6891408.1 M23 family metallopeptidase [Roseibium sp.]MBO6933278.1 M23 family metallopeptidase [Roseibium sp.]